MGVATVLEAFASHSVPQVINVEYRSTESVPAGDTSLELIVLELPGKNYLDRLNYPVKDLSGASYAIDLSFFSVNCLSENYNVRLFTKDDIASADTLYEVLVYSQIDRSVNDIFEKFIIKNDDDPISNKVYLFIENNGTVATGNIDIEVIYVTIQNMDD